ncbi:alpha tubulin suppressor [Zalaria obscura]|uniref:Alpha tubulin suppressor n=1 Tax=Zalaria obscura TaxID=2024903 RepID=A0ACC3S2X2_9PEZI
MTIYALGSNGSGQLGLGHLEDVSKPTLLDVSLGLKATDIKSIVAGGNHTLILTYSGDVYATGSNNGQRCGLDGNTEEYTTLQKVEIPSNDRISHCAATWEASVLVTADNSVLVCGLGPKGELGLGQGWTNASKLHAIHEFPPAGATVVDLAACMGHVVAVLSNGEVYGWGVGRNGQLGQPYEDVWAPRKLEGVTFKAVRAVCGKDFTCIFGALKEGEFVLLGPKRDRFSLKASLPARIPEWKDVSASWGSIYVLLPSGKLLAWGRDDHGQLPPVDIPPLQAMRAGSEHVVALTTSGDVLAWGWGEHGNCGPETDDRSDVKGRWNVLKLDGEVLFLGGGCATTWIVTDLGSG